MNLMQGYRTPIDKTVRSPISGYCADGWMDELGFYVPSTVFPSFRDDGRVNMKGSVQ